MAPRPNPDAESNIDLHCKESLVHSHGHVIFSRALSRYTMRISNVADTPGNEALTCLLSTRVRRPPRAVLRWLPARRGRPELALLGGLLDDRHGAGEGCRGCDGGGLDIVLGLGWLGGLDLGGCGVEPGRGLLVVPDVWRGSIREC